MPIANYSTTVSVAKTVGEIHAMLMSAGAEAIMTEYQNKVPSSVSFRITRKTVLYFQLPVDWLGVQGALKRSGVPVSGRTDEQAQRVAWRIVRDWLRAQLALIEADCAKLEQVMLPYLQDPSSGQTLYHRIEASQFILPPLGRETERKP